MNQAQAQAAQVVGTVRRALLVGEVAEQAKTEAERRIRKAATDLVLDQPFFGALVCKLKKRAGWNRPTAWTDGSVVGFHPVFINRLAQSQVLFVLAHEVLHCVQLHHTRRGNRDPKLYNVACDYQINLLLKDLGFDVLPCAMIDERFRGLSSDKIYSILADEQAQQSQQDGDETDDETDDDEQNDDDGDETDDETDDDEQDDETDDETDGDDGQDETDDETGDGQQDDEQDGDDETDGDEQADDDGDDGQQDGDGDETDSQDGDDDDDETDSQDGDDDDDETDSQDGDDDGDDDGQTSADGDDETDGEQDGQDDGDGDETGDDGQQDGQADGYPYPEDLSGSDPGGCGEILDAPEPEADAADWELAIEQAAQYAAGCGNMPGTLQRLVEDLLAPRVNWRERLRDFVDTNSKADYVWHKPNRRHVWRGYHLPSADNPELNALIVCVDTSASINREALAQFAAELRGICEDWQTSAHVIYCDTQVRGTQDVSADDLQELEPVGGGGTRYTPAFEAAENWILETGIQPSALIYLTDLECGDFPQVAPLYPVLWATWGSRSSYYGDPPFGEELPILD